MLLTNHLRDSLRALDVSTNDRDALQQLERDVYDASCDFQGFEDCSEGTLGDLQVGLLLTLDKALARLRWSLETLQQAPKDHVFLHDVVIERCRLTAALSAVLAVDDELDARLNFDAPEKV
tara:strand:- start:1444 stop:1806 length:363 start_codon:yes stop_codon:yes gene_type:complete